LIEKSTATVHSLLELIQYLFTNPEKHTAGIDLPMNPIAVYDRDGSIVKASEYFLKISDITRDDIQNNRANLFECLNTENKGLVEAAKGALYNGTKYFEEVDRPLSVKKAYTSSQMALYTKAAFFPITHNRDKSVEYGAAVFIRDWPPTNDGEEMAENR